ncbi:MAG: glutamate racemase [Planctomycetota bacterium]
MNLSELPYAGAIAIFDSGVGGLTVARAIRAILPDENLIYFGDTARVPYGTKSGDTILRFARENAAFLLRFRPRILVVACNTASAVAVDALRLELHIPVLGVVEPGARAAVAASRNRHVAVIGTETTISSGAYERALARLAPDVHVYVRSCPLFVPVVEEGRTAADPIVRSLVAEYLAPLRGTPADTLLLGCTHYPLLRDAIGAFMGDSVAVVDASQETAQEVAQLLSAQPSPSTAGRCYFLASDNPERFASIGSRFMGARIHKVFHVPPADFAR